MTSPNMLNGALLAMSFGPAPFAEISAVRAFGDECLAELAAEAALAPEPVQERIRLANFEIKTALDACGAECGILADRWVMRARIHDELCEEGRDREARALEARIGQARRARRQQERRASPQEREEQQERKRNFFEELGRAIGGPFDPDDLELDGGVLGRGARGEINHEEFQEYLLDEGAGERARGRADEIYTDDAVDEIAPRLWAELLSETRAGIQRPFSETLLVTGSLAASARKVAAATAKGREAHERFQEALVQLLGPGPRKASDWEKVSPDGGAAAHGIHMSLAAAAVAKYSR